MLSIDFLIFLNEFKKSFKENYIETKGIAMVGKAGVENLNLNLNFHSEVYSDPLSSDD